MKRRLGNFKDLLSSNFSSFPLVKYEKNFQTCSLPSSSVRSHSLSLAYSRKNIIARILRRERYIYVYIFFFSLLVSFAHFFSRSVYYVDMTKMLNDLIYRVYSYCFHRVVIINVIWFQHFSCCLLLYTSHTFWCTKHQSFRVWFEDPQMRVSARVNENDEEEKEKEKKTILFTKNV